MAYVRTVRTASGATAVQTVYSSRRGSRQIEHVGSAHNEAELAALRIAAAARLATGQAELDLDLKSGWDGSVDRPLETAGSRMAHLWEALCRAYETLGFAEATGLDEGFREPHAQRRPVDGQNKVDVVSYGNKNHAGRFSVLEAEHALRVACRSSGLDHANAELIRLGENALFRLSSQPVVVRISRTVGYWDDVVKEVEVARWLAEQRIPAARLHDVPQPIRAGEHPVTFWRYIAGRPGDGRDMAALGVVLRRVHRIPRPTTFDLPRQDIFGRVGGRIEFAPVPAADKHFLLCRVEELRSEVSRLNYPLSPTVTHGDAHVKNLMMAGGQPVLIDFEQFAWGQPEWDLALMATEFQTAGLWSAAEYGQFVEAYGYDVSSWENGFDVLRATHEIMLTTWLMQNVNESPEVASEYQRRMRTIRGIADVSDRWHPF